MSVAPLEAVKMNRSLVFTGAFDPALLSTIVEGRSKPWRSSRPVSAAFTSLGLGTEVIPQLITPASRMGMLEQLAEARKGNFGPGIVSCEALHPHRDYCVQNIFMKVVDCARLLVPVYGALHLIPPLLFKRKDFFRRPVRSILRVIFNTLRSSGFIGVFVAILQGTGLSITTRR